MIMTVGRRKGVEAMKKDTTAQGGSFEEKENNSLCRKENMTQSNVVSVECTKVKKKTRSNKALYFRLAVKYENEEKRVIDRPYIALFDFQTKIAGLFHSAPQMGEDVTAPVLRPIKWFEKHFLQVSKDDKRKAIEEFFQRLLALPVFISRSRDVVEFFEFHWSPSSVNSAPRTGNVSNGEQHTVVSTTNSSAATTTEVTSSALTASPTDRCNYEEVCMPECEPYDELNLKKSKSVTLREDTRPEGVDQTYIAINGYEQRKSGEVNLMEGNVVNVMQCELSGWWFVHVEDTNEQGWAPASCLLPTNRNSYTEHARPVVGGQLELLQTARAYEARSPDELSYKAGEPVEVLEAFMDGWWKVKCHGNVGLTPATYLEPIGKGTSKNSVYHMNVYRKNTPPPRRRSGESVDDLYAKVEEIQNRKRQMVANQKSPTTPQFKEDVQGYAEISESQNFDIEPYEELPMCSDSEKASTGTGSGGKGAVGIVGFVNLVKSGSQKYVNVGLDPNAATVTTSAKSNSLAVSDSDTSDAGKPQKPLPPLPSDDKSAQNIVASKKAPPLTTRQLTTEKPSTLPASLNNPKNIANMKADGSLGHCRNNSSPVGGEKINIQSVGSAVTSSSPPPKMSPPIRTPLSHPLLSPTTQGPKLPPSPGSLPILNDKLHSVGYAARQPSNDLATRTEVSAVKLCVPPVPATRPDISATKPLLPGSPVKQAQNIRPIPANTKLGGESVNPPGCFPADRAPGGIKSLPLPAVPVKKVQRTGSSDDGIATNALKKNIQPTVKPIAPDRGPKPVVVSTKPTTPTTSPKTNLTSSMAPPNFPPPLRDPCAASAPAGTVQKLSIPSAPLNNGRGTGEEAAEEVKSVPGLTAVIGRVAPMLVTGHDYEDLIKTKFAISRLDRVGCEVVLLQSREQRQFILRDSLTKPGHFALSVFFDGRVHHFPIERTSSGKFFIGDYNFETLDDVINYYQKNALFHSDDKEGIVLGNILK